MQTDMTDNLHGISRNWISQFLVGYPGNSSVMYMHYILG